MLHKYNKKVINKKTMKTKKIILAILLLSFFAACSSNKINETADEKKILKKRNNEMPMDMKERVEASNSGGIFSGGADKGTSAPFAANNVLWRATLESLDFVPLSSSDYPGGIIITDWYSDTQNSNESINKDSELLNVLKKDYSAPSMLIAGLAATTIEIANNTALAVPKWLKTAIPKVISQISPNAYVEKESILMPAMIKCFNKIK